MPDGLLDARRAVALLSVVARYLLPALVLGYAGRLDRAGVRIRLALEELGLTYLKFGQFMALRFDVVPAEIGQELRQLFDEVAPVRFDEVRAVIETELGEPLGAVFAHVEPHPIGSASVAQVHEARTHGGRHIALKIQRPGIEPRVRADLRNLRRLAGLIDAVGLLGSLSMRETIDEFAAWTVRELDFRQEASAADRLRQSALPFERIPTIHYDLTTSRLLAMEMIVGLSLADVSRLYDAGGEAAVRARLPDVDLSRVLARLSDAFLHQLFDVGFFHGDPHPGNIIVCADNRIAFVDFGIFGDLSPYDRLIVRRHVEAIAVGNIPESVRYYRKQLDATPETDEHAFEAAATVVLRRWYEASRNPERASVADRHLGKYSGEMLDLVRQYHLRMGLGTVLFWRSLIVLNSTALRFPEHFDLLSSMRTFFEPGPLDVAEDLILAGLDGERALILASLFRDMPGQITRILAALGEQHRAWVADLEEPPLRLRVNNRRAQGVTLALVGLSLAIVGLGAGTAPLDAVPRISALLLAGPVALASLLVLRPR